jgi:hypothetical protein
MNAKRPVTMLDIVVAGVLLCVGIVTVVWLMGCEAAQPDADKDQAKKTAASMAEANRQIGMPAITNFQERRLAKMIFELRDSEDLICYAYIINWEGELIYLGKCLGFGLPYSIQYTNPERIVRGTGGTYHTNMPQPDPNGLFMPEGLSATWLMMLDGQGNPKPVYVEPQIMVSPFPLHNLSMANQG